ncbi:helix-turn-helix domain-containing protein [Glaciecola sp. 1036]|uniref:helix-turn-helix domain-containing protein n=1 Tax=Alteromonadaceae TaxID=72275 RepID=UPI003D00281B
MNRLKDWHNIDVVAAIKKKTGLSLRQNSIMRGLHESAFQQALHKPYPKVEKIISEIIGVKEQDIWPSRFDALGVRKDGRRRNESSKSPKEQRI